MKLINIETDILNNLKTIAEPIVDRHWALVGIGGEEEEDCRAWYVRDSYGRKIKYHEAWAECDMKFSATERAMQWFLLPYCRLTQVLGKVAPDIVVLGIRRQMDAFDDPDSDDSASDSDSEPNENATDQKYRTLLKRFTCRRLNLKVWIPKNERIKRREWILCGEKSPGKWDFHIVRHAEAQYFWKRTGQSEQALYTTARKMLKDMITYEYGFPPGLGSLMLIPLDMVAQVEPRAIHATKILQSIIRRHPCHPYFLRTRRR
jgi:hypothetical protein